MNEPSISPTSEHALQELLQAVAQGRLSPEQALQAYRFLPFEPVGDFARVDHHRSLRTGFPEAVWGPGKTPEQIAQIMEQLHQQGSLALATRIEASVHAQIAQRLPQVHYSPMARLCWLPRTQELAYPGQLSVISAGTADLPVAEEAALTAELSGFQVKRLWDVGVAGIHRLLQNRQALQADVLIVVAGMEGALASVVAGLANCPVIAVPTSIGYGASFQGLAALLTMLNSCAAGVGVVNIDNGFGAAILAGQILRCGQQMATRLRPATADKD
ncbi:nickel pincer cofactor biosynthesis protein LarB [Synechococcus sp. Nb3U1]|uniref:nickel pincer cofactor biosynthesis protein LarB n=1 Tax=Synechococcus sp. Nb3U1 TaxID=1914529 RepID=UPI001F2A2C3E|nr:nickel pincer cofactor biosynthesis protein LarB [Synechococcus sp. Nb3U1]MCF2971025.1 nickel pincer cofactor biosynthesis protein LarB [Synechococcus sp. Nb3U1]